MEKWKIIKDFPDYMVSSEGRVYSFKTDRYLRIRNHSEGYSSVVLMRDGKRCDMLVHRLVAEAFLPNGNINNLVVNHKDMNRQNNAVENLEWLSISDNLKYTTAENGMSHNYPAGKSGERYIHIIGKSFRVEIKRHNFRRGASFPTLAEAVAYRKEVLGA